MSRTDKTRPFWVRKQDHKIERPRMAEDEWYVEYYTYKWWLGEMKCGCPMCSGQEWRKYSVRRDRREGKQQMRNWQDDTYRKSGRRSQMW